MKTPYIPHFFGPDAESRMKEHLGWLTAGVASSIAWPQQDVWLQYDGSEYVLRGIESGDERQAPCISTPCLSNEIDDALSRLYRFVSVLGWFKRGYVDVSGSVWGTSPIRYGSRDTFTTLTQGGPHGFSCNHMPVIENDQIRKALAFMREGSRLRHVHDAYSFLSFFKVIESQFSSKDRVVWITENLDRLDGEASKRVSELRAAGVDVSKHLFDSGRCAVAHASLEGDIVDPDVPADRRRIAEDLDIIEALAIRFLKYDAAVPDEMDLYEHRDRLVPWHDKMTPDALRRLTEGKEVEDIAALGELQNATISVRLWPKPPAPSFQSMTMVPDAHEPGVIYFSAYNERKTIFLAFAMDVAKGRMHTLLDEGGMTSFYNEIIEDEVAAYTRYFHSVVGNGLVELCIEGAEPVDCEVVIPVNIIPRAPEDAVAEAVAAFRQTKTMTGAAAE